MPFSSLMTLTTSACVDRYYRSLEVLCGRPGAGGPHLPFALVMLITATFVPSRVALPQGERHALQVEDLHNAPIL